jgi:hypothetical protein
LVKVNKASSRCAFDILRLALSWPFIKIGCVNPPIISAAKFSGLKKPEKPPAANPTDKVLILNDVDGSGTNIG